MRRIAPCLLLFLFVLADFALAREWVDSTGKHRVNAELVAVRGDKVVLETADGRIISIPIARLSSPDRRFLQERSTAKSDANPASTPAQPR